MKTQEKGLHFLAFSVTRERRCSVLGGSGMGLLAFPLLILPVCSPGVTAGAAGTTFLRWEILQDGKPCG